MRVIRNAYVDEKERGEAPPLPFPDQLAASAAGGLLGFAEDGTSDPEKTCMPAGQGIGGIDDVPTAGELIERLLRDTRATLEGLGGLVR
jgi:NAD(P)H-dependent flavin oxidoreductase YrpB (nitropropane dioxygenase family)